MGMNSALVSFINQHDGCRVEQVLNSGKRLEVSSICTLSDGSAIRVSEQIDATLTAVRRWLGY